MNVLELLASGPPAYRGRGTNHDGEPFIGALRVQVLGDGRAVLLHYCATLDDGTVAHTESTLLAPGPDGRLCLWPVMSELPVVLPHAQIETQAPGDPRTTAVFASGAREDRGCFREEITLAFGADGSLTYAHAWGLPAGPFKDRSTCGLFQTTA
ncbi:MAG: hypothetical protein ACK58C_17525 [Betaproteobacteria bacterium]